MNRLERAIAAFEEEDDLATFEEKLLNLGSALNWNVGQLVKSIHQHGLKAKQTQEEEYIHCTCMKLYNDMQRIHTSMKKILKSSGKSSLEIDNKWRDEMRTVKSNLSPIVRDLKAS